MESVLVAIAPQLVTIAAAIVIGLASWGLGLLRKKCNFEAGKVALDEVDQVIRTVVGDLSQTTVKELKTASEDGHLSPEDKIKVKQLAVERTQELISNDVANAANKIIADLGGYLVKKIEDQVLATKTSSPGV